MHVAVIGIDFDQKKEGIDTLQNARFFCGDFR